MVTELEDAFSSEMWEVIAKTAEKYGYVVGGGSHPKYADGKTYLDFGFICQPTKKKIKEDALIREHRRKIRTFSRKLKAKWAKIPMRKYLEWDGATLEAGKVYKSWTENEENAQTIRILGFRKDRTFNDMYMYYEVLSEPARPVRSGFLEGCGWRMKFVRVK